MHIIVKPGKPLELKLPQFLCDKPLKEDSPPPFHLLVNAFKMILILGRPGSGKTSLMSALFKDKRCFRKTWNNVLLVCPKTSLTSMKASDNPFKKLSVENWYEDLSSIDEIYERVRYNSEEKETSVIVMDDCMSQLKDGHIEKVLTHIVANRRHLKTSIIVLSQIYERVPLKVRKLINTIIVMYRPSKKEMAMIGDELLEMKAEDSQQLYKLAFDKVYSFLLIDVPTQQVYRNSDKLEILQDDEESD